MRTAFVTGSTGFLGLNIVEQLNAQGWRVIALHRPTSNMKRLEPFQVERVQGDILDLDSLRKVIPKGADAVFHTAANTSVWSKNNRRQTRENVEGTRNVVWAAQEADVKRLVHTSTWNTYGFHHDRLDEDTPQRGLESWINYDRTKSMAEMEVREGIVRGLEAVIMNPSHIVGRYDTHNWARVLMLVHQKKLPGIPPGTGSFCHAEEVARAHIAAAEKGKPGDNYLLGGTDASFLEVVRIVGELTGRPVPKRPLPAWLLKTIARIQTMVAAMTGKEPDLTPEAAAMVTSHPRIVSQKAERELGYRRVSLRVMLEDCHAWLQAEGLLAPRV